MSRIKVWIESREACISEMVCTVLCREVFEISREDGKVIIKDMWRTDKLNFNEGVVSGDLEECIIAAYENCPVEIIRWARIE
ncbi:MAG: ferredoxin [Acidilobaceae archaeon]